MYGAIVADVIGSRHASNPPGGKDFDLIHEDCAPTLAVAETIAVADALSSDWDVAGSLWFYGACPRHAPPEGAPALIKTCAAPRSALDVAAGRVSPAAWLARDIDECLRLSDMSVRATHDDHEAIRAARAVSAAVFAALSGLGACDVRAFVRQFSGYDLEPTVGAIRDARHPPAAPWAAVSNALACALDADGFEDAVRNSVSLAGRSVLPATGALAEALFGIPEGIREFGLSRLPPRLRREILGLRAGTDALQSARPREPLHMDDLAFLPVAAARAA